jgi:hypothetical protein
MVDFYSQWSNYKNVTKGSTASEESLKNFFVRSPRGGPLEAISGDPGIHGHSKQPHWLMAINLRKEAPTLYAAILVIIN